MNCLQTQFYSVFFRLQHIICTLKGFILYHQKDISRICVTWHFNGPGSRRVARVAGWPHHTGTLSAVCCHNHCILYQIVSTYAYFPLHLARFGVRLVGACYPVVFQEAGSSRWHYSSLFYLRSDWDWISPNRQLPVWRIYFTTKVWSLFVCR